jgi:hypothetical protein
MNQFIFIASETYLFSAFVTIVLLYHVGDCLKIDFMYFSKFKFYFRNLQLQKQKKPAAYGFIVNREAFVKRNVIIFFQINKTEAPSLRRAPLEPLYRTANLLVFFNRFCSDAQPDTDP